MSEPPSPLDPETFGAEQQCFGCGPHNPRGWRLRFVRDGDAVETRFTPSAGLEGPPGIFHGGLQATLLDEVAGWAVVTFTGKFGFTSSLRVRYMRPVRIDREVVGRATVSGREGDTVTVKASLAQDGRTAARATVSFALLDEAAARRTLAREDLPEAWRKFCR